MNTIKNKFQKGETDSPVHKATENQGKDSESLLNKRFSKSIKIRSVGELTLV